MNNVIFCIWFAAVAACASGDENEPMRQYIGTYSPLGGDSRFFADDKLLRADLDIDNDGQSETLITMARDRNGKQGNVWAIYKKSGSGYSSIGTVTFSPKRFYLGYLENGRYGLATFWPSGAGEGVMLWYVVNGQHVEEGKLGEVRKNRNTNKMEGEEILDRYLGEKAVRGDEVITTIKISDLAAQYGINVEPMTYVESLQERRTRKAPASRKPAPGDALGPKPGLPTEIGAARTPTVEPPDQAIQARRWQWVIGGVAGLGLIGAVLLLVLLKRAKQ